MAVEIDGANNKVKTVTLAFTDGDTAFTIADGGGVTVSTSLDMNGTELILDADADTSITADTDDQIDIKIAGADDFAFKANTFEVQSGSTIDMNGQELILDADQDTSITADTDDRIDLRAGGTDTLHVGNGVVTVGTPTDFGPTGFATGVKVKGDVLIGDFTNDSIASTLCFIKSRNTTVGSQTIVADDDEVGSIDFRADDGDDTGYNNNVARIAVAIDAAPGTNDTGGRITFATTADGARTASERMRIEEDGNVSIGIAGTSSRLLVNQPNNNTSIGNIITDASYSNHINYWQAGRAGSTAFNFVIAISNTDSSNDTEFRIQGTGATQSDGAYSGSGVDFGEYFEWSDGNSSDEVRYGYSVVLDGNKIRKATSEDTTSDIIGIISAHPTIIGDGDIDKWNQKYLRDDFNKSIMEEYTVTTWTETTYDGENPGPTENVSYPTDGIPSDVTVPTEDVTDSDGRVIKTKAVVLTTEKDGVTKLKRKKLNPDWDSSLTYIPREERKEWDVVGLVGKLRMHKGQPTNPNWKKMRDISDTVEEWLVR